MKKVFFIVAVVIAAVAGTVYYNYESDNELSDLAKKNVKALAKDDKDKDCDYFPECTCVILVVTPDGAKGELHKDQRNPMEIL